MAARAGLVLVAAALVLPHCANGGRVVMEIFGGRVDDKDGCCIKADSDAYVRTRIGTSATWQTKTKDDDNSPTWNERHDFGNQPLSSTVAMEVWDSDSFFRGDDDRIGNTAFALSSLANQGVRTVSSKGFSIQVRLTFSAINKCLSNNGGCGPNSVCRMTGDDTNSCSCSPDYESSSGDGRNCIGIDLCKTNGGGCIASTCRSTGANRRACDCAPDFEHVPGTADSQCRAINSCDRTPCGANSICRFLAPARHSCTCSSGFFSDDQTECNAHTICLPGTFQTAAATPSTDRACSTCPAGQFCLGGSNTPQDCGSVELFAGPGLGSCLPVSPGFFTTGPSEARRTSQMECTPGAFCVAGRRTPCTSGSDFQARSGQIACIACRTACPTGENLLANCIPAADLVCRDNIVPELVVQGQQTLTLEAVSQRYTTLPFTCTDSRDGDITGLVVVSSSPAPLGSLTARPGINQVAYTCRDLAGNKAEFVQRVIVQDTTPPTLRLRGQAQVDHEAGSTPYTDPGASAIDLVDGDISGLVVVQGLTALNSDLNRTRTVNLTYSVADAKGNQAPPLVRQVHVTDTRKPIILLNGEQLMFVEAQKTLAPFVDPGATARDEAAGDLTARIVVQGVLGVNISRLGTYEVSYTVTDPNMLAANPVVRTVVVRDTLPPMVSIPFSLISLEAGDAFVEQPATATDNFDADAAVTAGLQVFGTPVNPLALSGSNFERTYQAIDSSNNVARASYRVQVLDNQDPVLTLRGAPVVTLEARRDLYVEPGFDATDLGRSINSAVVVTNIPDTNRVGTYSIAYTVQDSAGNTASQTRTVHVVDTTPPAFDPASFPAALTVEAASFYAIPQPVAIDSVDGSRPVATDNRVQPFPASTPMNFPMHFRAADLSNNSVALTITATVVDTTPPTITIFAPVFLLEGGRPYSDLGVVAVDALDGDLQAQLRHTVVDAATNRPLAALDSLAPVGTLYNVTYTVADRARNAAAPASRRVRVVDTLPPSLNLVVPADLALNGDAPRVPYTQVGAVATDLHDGDLTASIAAVARDTAGGPALAPLADAVDSSAPLGTRYEVRLSVSDRSGHAANLTRFVTIVDTLPPAIRLAPFGDRAAVVSETADAQGNIEMGILLGATYTEPGATAVDRYDGDVSQTLNISGLVLNTSRLGDTAEVSYFATDAQGNNITVRRFLTVATAAFSTGNKSASSNMVLFVAVPLAVVVMIALILGVVLLRRRRGAIASADGKRRGSESTLYQNPAYVGQFEDEGYDNGAGSGGGGGGGYGTVSQFRPRPGAGSYMTENPAYMGAGGQPEYAQLSRASKTSSSGYAHLAPTTAAGAARSAGTAAATATSASHYHLLSLQDREVLASTPDWLHGALPREAAERVILAPENRAPGAFLIRYRDVHSGQYALTFLDRATACQHVLVTRERPGHFRVNNEELAADSLSDLVSALQHRPLLATGTLGRPVPRAAEDGMRLAVDGYVPVVSQGAVAADEQLYERVGGAYAAWRPQPSAAARLPPQLFRALATNAMYETVLPRAAPGTAGSSGPRRTASLRVASADTQLLEWFHGRQTAAAMEAALGSAAPGVFAVWHAGEDGATYTLSVKPKRGPARHLALAVKAQGAIWVDSEALQGETTLDGVVRALRNGARKAALPGGTLAAGLPCSRVRAVEASDGAEFVPSLACVSLHPDQPIFVKCYGTNTFRQVTDRSIVPKSVPTFIPLDGRASQTDDYAAGSADTVYARTRDAEGAEYYVPVAQSEYLDVVAEPTGAGADAGDKLYTQVAISTQSERAYVEVPRLSEFLARYVHKCGREAAEGLLMAAPGAAPYLVRRKGDAQFALSVRASARGKVIHHLLSQTAAGFSLDGAADYSGNLAMCVRKIISAMYPTSTPLPTASA